MDILGIIVAHKRLEVDAQKGLQPIEGLREFAFKSGRTPLSLRQALFHGSGIIAEFKRKSPSRGWIQEDADPMRVIPEYCAGGASALSILTDSEYFGGKLDYIKAVRPLVGIPILRKDFIIDPFQLYEARLAGADAVLLIAACLQKDECGALCDEAHRMGLEVLLEIHSESELDYVTVGADCIGVNNRNLGSFTTDVQNSFRLIGMLHDKVASCNASCRPALVSESGISSPESLKLLRSAGFNGFLLGEAFMKQASPGQALKDFIKEI